MHPERVGAGPRCGDSRVFGVERCAGGRIDRRLAEHEFFGLFPFHEEEPLVFSGTCGHPSPLDSGCSLELGPDRLSFFSKQEEHGVSPGIGIESSFLYERGAQCFRERAYFAEVVENAGEFRVISFWRGECGVRGDGVFTGVTLRYGEGFGEPSDGGFEVPFEEMNHQVDSASSTFSPGPVHEFMACDGDDPMRGVPFVRIVRVSYGSRFVQYILEVDRSDTIRGFFIVVIRHGRLLRVG